MLLRYNIYFNGFIFCEFLNFAIVLVQFFVTNQFLSRRFLLYGLEVPLTMLMGDLDVKRCGATTFFPRRSNVFLSSKTQCAKPSQG